MCSWGTNSNQSHCLLTMFLTMLAYPPSPDIFRGKTPFHKTICSLYKPCWIVTTVKASCRVRPRCESAGGTFQENGGRYGNNGNISNGDSGVSTVINHALWFWPHQGTSTQETETLKYHTHQRLSSTGGAGVQASLPQNGYMALGPRSCQMLALVENLMGLRTAEQMWGLNRTEMKG